MNEQYFIKIIGSILEFERENIANDYKADKKEMVNAVIRIIERNVIEYENQ